MEDDWIDPLKSTAAPASVPAMPSPEKPVDDWGATPSLATAPYPAMAEPKPEPKKEEPSGVLGTVSTAISNVPESAMKFAEDIVYPILHPIQTAESLGSLALGLTQKLIPGEQEQEKYVDALGQGLYDRYGTLENVKKTFMHDPIGMLSDISGIVSGGTLLAGKVGKAAAKTAYRTPALAAYETAKSVFSDAPSSIQKTVSVAGDIAKQGPLYFPKKAAEATIAVGNQLAGFKSGVGPEALEAAYKAGKEGGPRLQAFKRSFRDLEPMEDVVSEARSAITNMRKAGSNEYLRGIGRLDLENKVLDFDKINEAIASGREMQRFKGKSIPMPKEARLAKTEMIQEIQRWRSFNPKIYHTPEGLDALKRGLWGYVEKYEPNTPAHKAAKDIYESVRSTIIKEVPEYAPVMKAYEESMELIKEIERSLSLGKKSATDTALRKLQSVLRNNVNTSYGYRQKLAEYLVQNGSPFLMEKLAGQALNPIAARGMARFSTDIALTTMGLAGAITTNPLAVGMMAPIVASSPRAMGNLFMLAGIADRYASKLPKPKLLEQSLVQSGRFAQEAEPLVGSQTEEYPTEEGSVFDKMQRARGGKVSRPFARAEGGYLPSEDYLVAMRKSESFKPKAYWDVKQYSIGYGTKAKSPDEEISQDEAMRRFYQEVTPAASMVNRFAPDAPEGVKAALTSLTYNAGPKWMESGLGKAIKDEDYDKARQIFLQYTKADGKELEGLKRRRESEARWFGNPAISAGGVSPEAYEALDETYREQTGQPKTDQDKLDELIADIVRTPAVQPMSPMAPIQALPRATVPTVMPYSRADGGRAEVRSFEPTISDRIAQYLLGEEKVSPEYRRVVEGLTGSSGLGRTGIGVIDVTPAGIPTAVQEGKRAAEEGRYGEAALTAASLMPLPALQTAGQAAKTVTKSLDPLGYFSGALEAAKALTQNKGTPEQMLAMLEKTKGVKRAEIEATGLDKFLADKKSVTKDDIVQYLDQNRIKLNETAYGHPGKWTKNSLDPSNPTYRETVLNLPRPSDDIQRRMDALTAEVEAKGIQPGTPEWDAYEKEFYDLSDKKHSLPRNRVFQSDHFSQPNIVGHMMTSTVKHEGQPTFLIDQIQSDWGQKIRDSGARSEEKIAELKQSKKMTDEWFLQAADKINNELDALNPEAAFGLDTFKADQNNLSVGEVVQERLDRILNAYGTLVRQNKSYDLGSANDFIGKVLAMNKRLERAYEPSKLLDAEIRAAESAALSNPLVNTTDQWVNTTLRKALMQAADEDAKYIAIPSGDTVLSYNPGKPKGMREFYGAIAEGKRTEGIVPKNLRNILTGLDKNAPKPFVVDTLEAPKKGQAGQGFTLFPLTPELKQKIKEGLPLFTAAGALPFVASQQQEQTKAHGGSVTDKMWRNKMRRTH